MYTIERYVLGNKDKTEFLGYDSFNGKYLKVPFGDPSMQLMDEETVDMLIKHNKYTLFFFTSGLKFKYKLVCAMA